MHNYYLIKQINLFSLLIKITLENAYFTDQHKHEENKSTSDKQIEVKISEQ